MKRRLFLVVLALTAVLSAASAWAEDPRGVAPLISEAYPNALGFSFGSNSSPVSIFNLHYQRWLGDFGFDVSIGAAKDLFYAGTWGADGLFSFQYKFSDGNLVADGNFYGALYGFLRSGYVIQRRMTETWNNATESYDVAFDCYQYVPAIVGVGIEATFFKHISMPVEVGFEYRVLTEDFGPTFSGSLRYRF